MAALPQPGDQLPVLRRLRTGPGTAGRPARDVTPYPRLATQSRRTYGSVRSATAWHGVRRPAVCGDLGVFPASRGYHLQTCPGWFPDALGASGLRAPGNRTAGLAAPRLPLAAFSSVNSLSEAASLLGPCQGLPGTAAHYSSALLPGALR